MDKRKKIMAQILDELDDVLDSSAVSRAGKKKPAASISVEVHGPEADERETEEESLDRKFAALPRAGKKA